MYIEATKDSIGNTYYAININYYDIEQYDTQLHNIIGDEYIHYRNNKLERDRNKYHITVLNAINTGKMIKHNIDFSFLLKKDYDIKFKGVGSVKDNDNEAYFIVVECDELISDLGDLGIYNIDLHITLAFKTKDIFKQRKNTTNII